ncbi:hypothetical protein ACIBEA_44035 [Streptomyces sp. NPDC051555]|uniref:hypothetical protein n=1 Tax=Streptomyces sp. NPDC051555 TaxID=3365657 RepID=UPI0037BA1986
MPDLTSLRHFEIGYQGRSGRQPLVYRTITGTSPQDALQVNLAVLRDIGVGGPAGLRLHAIRIDNEEWEPRVARAYPAGTGPQLTREGLPLVHTDFSSLG